MAQRVKVFACKSYNLSSNPWSPHKSGKRKPTPPNCPWTFTFTHALWNAPRNTHTHHIIIIKFETITVKQNVVRNEAED